ncbi:MAG TPA: nitronate monooxygenase [Gemmatimonadaceae bacterium]|nr:nitronate monooxygenase [Gemmatimonadaceae bacterium]
MTHAARPAFDGRFLGHAGVRVPVIGGAMYPCSNPELVGAVSAAGALGILQPISLTYVHGHDFREGIRLVRRLAGGAPIGMNALIETSSRAYHERMVRWVAIALEEGVRFFITSLGNPRWVVDRVASAGAVVYHDVTEAKWARKGVDAGVDGLIAVNDRAGGHAGDRNAAALREELAPFGLPLVCAGGIGDENGFTDALRLGYAAVQLGTRFIATGECNAHPRYKQAILDAGEEDIVHTERLTGVPVAVIRTPYTERVGLAAGPLARWMLRGRRRKRLMRTIYGLRSITRLKQSLNRGDADRDYWQAGKSVAHISTIESVADIVRRFEHAFHDPHERSAVAEYETDRARAGRSDSADASPSPAPVGGAIRRLGTITVGRKTPLDGKLEIDAEMAQVIGAYGYDVMYVVQAASGGETTSGLAKLTALACTCGQAGAGAAHTHHFLGSPPFKALEPGTSLALELDPAGFVRLEPAAGGAAA